MCLTTLWHSVEKMRSLSVSLFHLLRRSVTVAVMSESAPNHTSARRLTQPLEPFVGRQVLVGVSGGADSVGLLRALLAVGALPAVAHLDHALRPESVDDAAWVSDLCARLGVPCEVTRIDVGAVAARRNWNLEDAARRLRYDVLSRAAKHSGAEVILTAHTRRDQAETVLMELLRGEGRIRGIPPQRGRVRRPWLNVGRAEIETYLRGLGQDWREDASNADPRFTRAWLRREVMPVLLTRFPAAETALAQVAELGAEDDAALQALAARLTPHTPLDRQPPAVLRRWLAAELRSGGLDFTAEQLRDLAGALNAGQTRHLTLPTGRDVTVTGGHLYTAPCDWPEPDFPLPPDWTRRTRQAGDRIRLAGGTRKLSDVLTDAHLPRAERDRVPLLTDEHGAVQWVGVQPPLWAVGARESLGLPADPLHAAMGEALALAQQAAERQEVPVGAVVLNADGEIVGRGRNTSREDGDMTCHAELAALREAAAGLGTPYLSDCTLVVTLEPCPMCLGAALEARIGHIVYGAANPKAGALGGVSDLLADHWGWRPTVQGGVRAGEAARLLREVFGEVRRRSADTPQTPNAETPAPRSSRSTSASGKPTMLE
ncbi:tRNA lysidine(34) synthetase TilS [Deinococcus radiodurans]|nr:tRNA lysidine(34) synthetase TilS [Deinococcus radiodurans]QIP29282.1 tRNA lysidine(34) synthetase TilS [Deinococcus radiodurans]QIP32026.1 tRNA lysidine(34) synthetase TilS [Deinococcus radiodurans]